MGSTLGCWAYPICSALQWGGAEASFSGSFLPLSLGMLALEGMVALSFGICSEHQTQWREASAHARLRAVTWMTPACLHPSVATGRDS